MQEKEDPMPPFLFRECRQGLLSPPHEPAGLTSRAICLVHSYWLFPETLVDELLVSLEPVSNLFSIRWHRWGGCCHPASTRHHLATVGPFPTKPCWRLAVLREPVSKAAAIRCLGVAHKIRTNFLPHLETSPAQSWLLPHTCLWIFRTHPF